MRELETERQRERERKRERERGKRKRMGEGEEGKHQREIYKERKIRERVKETEIERIGKEKG